VTAGPAQLEDLRAEARYRRERYDLYKAKMYGGRPTSPARLRELERAYDGAKARLDWAEQERALHNRD
jgi:hypothetical protein